MSRVLYVWNYREWGGAQIYYLSLAKAAKSTFDVAAVIPQNSDAKVLEYLADLGVAVEFCDPALPTAKPRDFVEKLRQRIKVFRSENRLVTRVLDVCGESVSIPVVHIDLGFWQSYRALKRLCHRANVFVTQHTALTDPGGLRGAIWRWKGKRMSRLPNFFILASNHAAKESLSPFLTKEKLDSIRVTYTGIDPQELAAVVVDNAGQAGRLRSGTQPLVMTLGQFVERKGCWVVLESLKKLADLGEEFQFVWIGTAQLEPAVLERINRYGLGERFRYMAGAEVGQTRLELLQLLGIADIFVLASVNEGLPIALVEAMALGLPCIATRVGAISEAIDHDASGLLIEPNNADALGAAIRTLLHDKETRRMFGTAARAIAFEKFDQRKTAEETVAIYDSVARS
jgi:glycosyltransferase involved in cell wall biosynthesis